MPQLAHAQTHIGLQVLLLSHWLLIPVGVRRDSAIAGTWQRGAGPMSTWDKSRVEQWALERGVGGTIVESMRAAHMDGKAVVALTPQDFLQVSAG